MTNMRGRRPSMNRAAELESLLQPSESPSPPSTPQLKLSNLRIGPKSILFLTALAIILGSIINDVLSDLPQRLAEERNRWESERQSWEEVRMKERKDQADLRQRVADERARWDAERQAWEEVRLRERMEAQEECRRAREKMTEEEERKKAGIHWLEVERAPHCTRYGTRGYRAKLGPVAGGYDVLKACRETGVEIHGRVMKPTYCEDMGGYNEIWGFWVVDFDEAACHTFWDDIKDKGCTAPGSGLRHIEARLKNHDAGDEWTAMCASTPYDFNGLHFDGAMSCANWGKDGIFGFWDIEDENCK